MDLLGRSLAGELAKCSANTATFLFQVDFWRPSSDGYALLSDYKAESVLSDRELVFLLALDAQFQFPFYQLGSIVLRAPNTLFQRSTAGHMFRSVQDE